MEIKPAGIGIGRSAAGSKIAPAPRSFAYSAGYIQLAVGRVLQSRVSIALGVPLG